MAPKLRTWQPVIRVRKKRKSDRLKTLVPEQPEQLEWEFDETGKPVNSPFFPTCQSLTRYVSKVSEKSCNLVPRCSTTQSKTNDPASYAYLLRSCGNANNLDEGRRIHESIAKNGQVKNVFLANLLIEMYGKCGSLQDAQAVFEKLEEKNVYSWTIMIGASMQCGSCKAGIYCFEEMQLELTPDKVSFLKVCDACAGLGVLAHSRLLHSRILLSRFHSDSVLNTALMKMYGHCKSVQDAHHILNTITNRDVIAWTTLISVYTENNCFRDALTLYQQMEFIGIPPDDITLISILDACISNLALTQGKRIHAGMVGIKTDCVNNVLINMYGKCRCPEDALQVFQVTSARDLASWNALVTGLAKNNQLTRAINLFLVMEQQGIIPDNITYIGLIEGSTDLESLAEGKFIHAHAKGTNLELDVRVATALIIMYGKCRRVKAAERMFEKIMERDLILWTAMIGTYAQNEHGNHALQLFQQMKLEGMMPDKHAFVNILEACAHLGALSEGKALHDHINASGLAADFDVAVSLINMYGKCGSPENAQKIFYSMPRHNVIIWTIMISFNGLGENVPNLLQKMLLEGVLPNSITFLAITSMCSHVGLVDEGCHCVVSMGKNYAVAPAVELYDCMVDLLGRAGWLDEAEGLVDSHPFQPSASPWTALLSACTMHGDLLRGRRAAKWMRELDQEDAVPYVLLSNISANCFADA